MSHSPSGLVRFGLVRLLHCPRVTMRLDFCRKEDMYSSICKLDSLLNAIMMMMGRMWWRWGVMHNLLALTTDGVPFAR